EAYEIVKLLFKDLQNSLSSKGIKANLSENGALLIAKNGFDPDFGARPLKRAIYDMIEDKLSDMILADELNENDNILIDAENDEIVIKKIQN
ncbi:ATP-dependent chaperone ClpB, partial [Campylobacter sp. RM10538]|nr:ATP-dependent chaperone ClpB [Campylobacter sp. RM10538]